MAKRRLDIYSTWKRQEAEVNSLYLDPKNVRLEIDDASKLRIDQGSIINDLFTKVRKSRGKRLEQQEICAGKDN